MSRTAHRPAPLLLVFIAARLASAQPGAEAPTAYVACSLDACDLDYFQTEVAFVRYVRDRADADLYVLVVSDETGGGGARYTLFFRGQRALAGRADTLTARVIGSATDDERRQVLARRLALGFAVLAADTPLADRLRISAAEAGEAAPSPERDPWDGWVLRLSGNGYFQGQQALRSASLYADLTAERITDALKLSLRVYDDYNRDAYEVDSVTTITSTSSSYGTSGLVVWSLSDHWSAGARASAWHSTFSNVDLIVEAGPAVEYDVFPYDESTRRQLRFLYGVGLEAADYAEETIFGKTHEVLPQHSLTTAVEYEQPWGSVDVSLDLSQYLSKPSKYRAQLFGELDLRLVRGLSFNVGGYYALVRNQIALPAAGATPEEILTEQRALATSYEYYAFAGFTYALGSIFNPVVNPRFSG